MDTAFAFKSRDPAHRRQYDNGHWSIRPHRWHTAVRDHFEQKEFLNVLCACLAGLPRRIARIFMMREMEGVRIEARCHIMGIRSTDCWTMLSRVRNGSGALGWWR
ncbi:MAG: hypothetical protein V2J65_35445 [Desulfobacteraceae bacterium]|nr:hypothetical protein [Desulfobacteraceae bacterium]